MPRVMRRLGEPKTEVAKPAKKKPKLSKFDEKIDQFFKKNLVLQQKMNSFLKNATEYFVEVKKDNKEMLDILKAVKGTNQEVDQTLCKVLLAIRQNEYLQAWHPEKDPSNPFKEKRNEVKKT